jgi:hypothetical protein
MNKRRPVLASGCIVAALALGPHAALQAHHSFAPYDMDANVLVTGVVLSVNPDANHLQIFFAKMNEERTNVERDKDGKHITWSVEMAGSAASAQDGISVNSFPKGTVFSVGLRPQRHGDPSGFRNGPLFKCPMGANGKAVPPKAGKYCDSVEGNTRFGAGNLPAPTQK